ncbi:MAG TPA: hypothetical protein VFT22_23215 [Kofleriaceae bacterium]|nr:hypothetical protein [Kofleriaceae bacterium]
MTRPGEAARAGQCLSRLTCDQLLNGERDDPTELLSHLASCPRCAALVATHRRERAEFSLPLPQLRPARRRTVWLAAATAAAAIVVWLVVSPNAPDDPPTRTKGKPAIGFFVQHHGDVRRGGPGEIVFPGDALNFTASVDRPSYLAILSSDAAHTVTTYYPAGPIAARLPAGGDQVLPLAVLLDGVLGIERVHGVFCDQPLAVALLAVAIDRGTALPDGCRADVLTLDKRGAR